MGIGSASSPQNIGFFDRHPHNHGRRVCAVGIPTGQGQRKNIWPKDNGGARGISAGLLVERQIVSRTGVVVQADRRVVAGCENICLPAFLDELDVASTV